MAAVILLNVIFCAFVIVGIVSLLAWGIRSDRVVTAKLGERRRVERRRSDRRRRPAFSPAYTRGS